MNNLFNIINIIIIYNNDYNLICKKRFYKNINII